MLYIIHVVEIDKQLRIRHHQGRCALMRAARSVWD